MKYYAIGMILLTILSINDVTDTAFEWTENSAAISETGTRLAFGQLGEHVEINASTDFSLLPNTDDPSGAYEILVPQTNDGNKNQIYEWYFRTQNMSDFEGLGEYGTQEYADFGIVAREFRYRHEVHYIHHIKSQMNCGSSEKKTEVIFTPSLFLFPNSGQYQLAEFTGKDGDQFDLTDDELAANTLTFHHISDKIDFALDAPLDTANHRWLYEYFDEYGYDRTNHLEVQQSNVTASVDSFGVTSRFKMSGLQIENNTFNEANLRLLITPEDDGEQLAMSIEGTPFSFTFERIGDAPNPSGSSLDKMVTRR